MPGKHLSRSSVMLLACIVAACADMPQTTGVAISSFVVGDAATAVGASGTFTLPGGGSTELTAERAVELATAYARATGRWLRSAWEEDRGDAVDVDQLHQCGRVYYAKSAFSPLPDESSGALRRLYASRWLVTLCGKGGQAQVTVGVPANATELTVTDGRIVGLADADFTSFGMPASVGPIPPSPEASVEAVARLTGRRISQVPELVLPPPPFVPQLAKWRLALEAPASIREAEGMINSVVEVYYGFGRTWHRHELLAGLRQDVERVVQDPVTGERIAINLLPGYADDYRSVTVER